MIMKLVIAVCMIWASVSGHPMEDITFLDDIFYTDNNTCYSADYDIVDVHLPTAFVQEKKIFLVQKDIKNKVFKGTFILDFDIPHTHNMSARKLLDNGKCIASDDKLIYFGTTDGIYVYNYSKVAVEKYGSITDDIRDIEVDKHNDVIYIVTEDHKLYLVKEGGNEMAEHDIIRNVEEIAMGGNNLYFYEKHDDPDKHLQFFEKYKKPKVLVGNKIIDITGLPDLYTNMKLMTVLVEHNDQCVLTLNNMMYTLYPNGTSVNQKNVFLNVPTAASVGWGVVHTYGLNRKLYCFVIDFSNFIRALGKALEKAFSDR